ncbi:MAG: radical SAM protein [Lachnospiraceae bacterium]|nr:radical SAM protein [Lachnospiraceae bacterium]
MNQYIKNLRRIEFVITWACTGRCKHCSEGEHTNSGVYIDGNAAARVIHELCGEFDIDSVMTFGGEPLLHIDEVCMIHKAAYDMNIPRRQIITNGYFSKDSDTIKQVVMRLAESGVNDILLSVDAFHQETIPLEPVKTFAMAVKSAGISLRTQPAWLVSKEDANPYNKRTAQILQEFESIGIGVSDGNIIFPEGNALKYLGSYFDLNEKHVSPYTENPEDVRAICISPDGGVFLDNIYRRGILDIIENYVPDKG